MEGKIVVTLNKNSSVENITKDIVNLGMTVYKIYKFGVMVVTGDIKKIKDILKIKGISSAESELIINAGAFFIPQN